MEKLNILYICHTAYLGGAALSLYNMIHSMRDSVLPVVLLPQKGESYELFTENNIRCIVHPFRMNIREKSKVKHIVRFIPHYLRDKYFNSRCINSVISDLNGMQIDIVHSNASVFTIGVDLSKKLSAKHVWHIREFQDLDFNFQPFTGWKRLKKMIYASDAVIAITKSVYNHWELNKARNAYYIWDAVRCVSDINSCVEIMEHVASVDVLNIINNAQQYAIENFSEEKYGDKITKIYKEMTNFDLIC